MKHVLIFSLLLCAISAEAQVVDKGWYFFKNPMSDIYGIGFNKPSAKTDLVYVGSDIPVGKTDLVVLDGPDESFYVDKGWRQLVLGTLFNNSKSLTLTVHSYKPKRVLLSGKKWQEFDKRNYYVIEGLKADSVIIRGRITNKNAVDSKDLEKIISTFATPTTVAFKVISAVANKEASSKDNKGIIYREAGRNDTFAIIVRNPNVYFASKLVQLNSNPKDIWRAPLFAPYNNESKRLVLDANNKVNILERHHVDNLYSNGVDLGLIFSYDELKKLITISLFKQETGKSSVTTPINTLKIDGGTSVMIDEEYPFNTNPSSTGYSTSEKYLTLIDYKVEFNPLDKSLKVYGYQTIGNQSSYQTCIYQIKNKFNYWPVK